MQNDNKKSKFQAGLLSVLAFMSKLAFANKVAKLAERFKFKMGFSAKRRHRHTYGGPEGHTFATKRFVGARTASRRARNFLKYHRYHPWAKNVITLPQGNAPE